MTRRAWVAYLSACLVAATAFFFLPDGGFGQAAIFTGLNAATLVAILAGLRLHRPQRRLAWLVLAVAHGSYVIAVVFWHAPDQPFPGPADIFFLTAYSLIVVGVTLMIRARSAGKDPASLLDAVIVTMGAAILSYVGLMAPYLRDASLSLPARLVSVAYPALDLLMLSVLLRLAFTAQLARLAAYWFLGAALAAQLLSDTLYAMRLLDGTFYFGGPSFVGWLLSFTLFGAAALHPSMRRLTEPKPAEFRTGLPKVRLGLVAAAGFIALVAVLSDQFLGPADGFVVATTAGVLVLLIGRVVGSYLGRLEAAIAMLGVLAVALVIWSTEVRERGFKDVGSLERAAEEIRSDVSAAHLWLEEHFAGDRGVEVQEQIYEPLRHASGTCAEIRPTRADSATTERLCQRLKDFQRLTTVRVEATVDSGLGTKIEQRYDRVFERVLVLIDRQERAIGALGTRENTRLDLLRNAVVLLLVLLFVLIAVVVFRNRRAIEEQTAAVAKQASELERSNADLEQFAYVASHDLQEPLRMISSFVHLLERRYGSKLDETANQYIQFAADGANRMNQLIDDLLEYSRVGRREMPLAVVDTHVIVDRAVENLGPRIDQTGASIEYDGLPRVRANESQLTQLFQNLIGNAIKFRGQERPSVAIAGRRDGDDVLFAVRDNGIGLDEKYKDRVFTIFQRLHTRDEYAGTGIGLSICKKIVERHGGTIWFESEPGRGTTFYFTLPAPRTPAR